MKKIMAIFTIIWGFLLATPAYALQVTNNIPDAAKTGQDANAIIKNVTNTLSFVAGVAAVIAIIIGGIMYITSAGDEKRIESAKNTILYAVIGLVVAILAYAIANFVISGVTTQTPH